MGLTGGEGKFSLYVARRAMTCTSLVETCSCLLCFGWRVFLFPLLFDGNETKIVGFFLRGDANAGDLTFHRVAQ